MIWRPYYHKRIAQLADFLCVILSFYISFELWKLAFTFIHWQSVSPPLYYDFDWYLLLPAFALLFIWILNYLGAYSLQRFTSYRNEFWIVFKATLLWLFIAAFALYMVTHVIIQRTYLILEFLTVFGLLFSQKMMLLLIVKFIRKNGFNRHKVILIGTGIQANLFIETVLKKFSWGFDIIGIVVENNTHFVGKQLNLPVLGTYNEIEKILKQHCPDELIVTIAVSEISYITNILDVCQREGVLVRITSDFFGRLSKNIQIDQLYGLNIISLNTVSQSEMQGYIKRLIDILGSISALILFFPFMIIASLGILITDGRPVFYNWKVVGLNKKPFKSWKFRTMVKDADMMKENLKHSNEMNGPVFKISNDPRILPFGQWLRKWSIDETPQFFSVLKGDMSIVGPRPAGPHELDQYESWHRRKLSIKPGITCLWQASGRNKINNFDDWVKLDLEYIDNWSIWLDLKIIFMTIVAVLKGTGK